MEKLASICKNPEASSFRGSQSDQNPVIPASSLSLKSVLLDDWWLVKSENKGIAVAGFALSDLGARLFYSAPISRRINATTLETRDGITIAINGFINRSRTLQSGFSVLVCNHFQIGFPFDWEGCLAQFYVEESAKRDSTSRKNVPRLNANTYLSTLDELPATSIRDLVMRLAEDSENLSCDDILGKLSDTFQHTPMYHSNLESEGPRVTANSEVDQTVKNHKKAKTHQMHKELTRSTGVVTRSRYRSKNMSSKQEENLQSKSPVQCRNFRNKPEKCLSSNFSLEGEVTDQILTPAANKKLSEGASINLKASSGTVRRSGRPNIRKNYTGMN
ncbi:hypothetical protein JCGZ_23792 [Jatropha curcas]|uniref:SANTA domain-containing protein n=1 Tax=Jatropha curcas TaxID=180498 RepID=A0A067LEB4_JATCU|nr:hypothetical protein JCGZ_23792 [Jatropha curcas]